MKGFWVLTAALLFGVAAWAAGDASLLPADEFAPGWAKEGRPKIYEGEALYDHIDGGGEAFLELGFEACTLQRYRRGAETLVVEIYRMTDPAAALGIYLASCGRETPDPGLNERHTVGHNQLLLAKGRFYLVITSPDASPGMPKVLSASGGSVAKSLPAADPPACLALLPKEGLEPGSLRIVRGAIGLQSLVTLGEGDFLLLERKATAVAGDYREGGGLVTLIVADYPSGQAAKEALRHLTRKLDSTLSPVSASDAGLLFKDRKGLYGKASVEGTRMTLRLGLATQPE